MMGHPAAINRIALCGYEGEHNALEVAGWSVWEWKTHGGHSNQAKGGRDVKANYAKERIWFSPHCRPDKRLF